MAVLYKIEFDEATLEKTEQELSQLDPTILQHFQEIQAEDTAEARKIIDNALRNILPDEEARLPKPQRPQPHRPISPPRERRRADLLGIGSKFCLWHPQRRKCA